MNIIFTTGFWIKISEGNKIKFKCCSKRRMTEGIKACQ